MLITGRLDGGAWRGADFNDLTEALGTRASIAERVRLGIELGLSGNGGYKLLDVLNESPTQFGPLQLVGSTWLPLSLNRGYFTGITWDHSCPEHMECARLTNVLLGLLLVYTLMEVGLRLWRWRLKAAEVEA